MMRIVKPIAPVLEDDFIASIEGSTIGFKDDLESMRDNNSEDEKETGNVVEAEAGGGSIKLGRNHGKSFNCALIIMI